MKETATMNFFYCYEMAKRFNIKSSKMKTVSKCHTNYVCRNSCELSKKQVVKHASSGTQKATAVDKIASPWPLRILADCTKPFKAAGQPTCTEN